MSLKRPKRRDYASDPDWHVACLRYLDAKWPGREGQRKRIAAFARWEAEYSTERVRARIADLLEIDDWTAEEADEFDRLAALWKWNSRQTAGQIREAHRGT